MTRKLLLVALGVALAVPVVLVGGSIAMRTMQGLPRPELVEGLEDSFLPP